MAGLRTGELSSSWRESVELDFQILDPDGEGLEMSVLLVAAKRELIESKTRVCGCIGITAPAFT